MSSKLITNTTLPLESKRDDGLRFLLYLFIYLIAFGAIPNLVRLLGDNWYWVGNYVKIVNPLLILYCSVELFRLKKVRLDDFSFICTILIICGVLVGNFSGGQLRYFIPHLFVGCFILLMYAFSYNATISDEFLKIWFSQISKIVLGVYTILIGLFYLLVHVFGFSIYMGISTGEVVIPFTYYLVKKRYWLALLAVFVIILSGKRGPLLAVLAELFIFVVPGKRLSVKVFMSALGTMLILLVFFLVLARVDPSYFVVGRIGGVLDKWALLNPFSENFDFALGSAGRSSEIICSFEQFNTSLSNWIFGQGYGWSYFNSAEIPGVDTYNFYNHYIHFSPLNFLYNYGLPLALVFFLSIWIKLTKLYKWSLSCYGKNSEQYGLLLYFIGALINGFTGYNYSMEPYMWVIFGILTQLYRTDMIANQARS